MERCFEVVEAARPNNSVIWQTHSSPPWRARNMRTRFSSPSALATAMNSRIFIHHISTYNETYYTASRCCQAAGGQVRGSACVFPPDQGSAQPPANPALQASIQREGRVKAACKQGTVRYGFARYLLGIR